MPRRRRRGRGRIRNHHIEPDENERFVFKRCAAYLKRHLNRYPVLDRETMKVLCWTLGHEAEGIGENLLDHFSGPKKDEFEEELLEWQGDPDGYGEAIGGMLGKVSPGLQRTLKLEIMNLLDQRIQKLGYRGRSDIEKNVMALKKMFSLTEQETEFCIFVYIISNYEALENFFVTHLECQKLNGKKYLINALALTHGQLNEILGGTLEKIGLFEMDKYNLSLADGFQSLFENPSARAVSKNFFSRIPRNTVSLEHHFVGKEQTEHILELLREKSKKSTHILLYGPPGTGKTSFACGLAEELGISAYGIARGEENTTRNRRAAILACLNMTNTGLGSLILVDEADNILNTRFSWFMRGETQDKGWLNQILEGPGARMIWITNRIDDIEESVLRRFAFSLHFKSFNRRQRIRLWENILRRNRVKRFFSQSDIVDLTSKYNVSAGAIDLAVKKTLEACPGSKRRSREAVALALDAHQTLLNSGEKTVDKESIEKNYSLDGLNIEGDPKSMIGQLEKFDEFLRRSEHERRVNMNLLFYGPPGTGKSELARYIAKRLDREIMCKRVSDIQSPYVGVAEQNIKHAFAQAEADEAILIIDEADSLLFSRDRAHHSWEISFTNEFLTQMERFRGVLICTTNRLKDLDEASIRRFNHKIGFRCLSQEGNVIFYKKLLSSLIHTPVDEETRVTLRRIAGLSPGDFRTVRDRFSFHPPEELTHQILVQALQEEARLKKIHKGDRHIGF